MTKDMTVEFDVFGNVWLHLVGMGLWIAQQLLGPELVLMPSMSVSAGIPSEQEFVAAYCRERGCNPPDQLEWTFCIALSLFRCAAIVAGVGARARMGNASSRNALQVCWCTGCTRRFLCLPRQDCKARPGRNPSDRCSICFELTN